MSRTKMQNVENIGRESTKILVIDDEQGLRDLLRTELSLSGYKVVTAANGVEGLEVLKKEKVQLVISDVKMPKMDGLQVLANIKKMDPDVEVIMVTGYGTVETAVSAMKKGAYDFVQKPFNLDEILSLVEKALEKAELRAMVALYEASKAIFSAIKLEDLLPVLINLSLKLLKADDVSIMLMGEDGKLYIAASHGLDDKIMQNVRLALGERIAGKIAEWKKTTTIVGSLDKDPRFAGIESRETIRSSVLCPLFSKTDILGVLCAARTKNEIQFNESDQRYANIFSVQVSQAIENARLYKELESKVEALNQAYARLAQMQNDLIQTEKLAAIGELASGVAHELNNPLTTVIGLVDLLRDEPGMPQSCAADLITIKEQAERCSKIILNLLQFSRRHETDKKLIQMDDVLDKTLELVQYDLKSSSVEISREKGKKLPNVKADPYQLQQVFINIVSNARYAMQDTPAPCISVQSLCEDGKVKVSISDNGCGISEKILGKIFDPFFTTKEVGKGTGLGLSISYGIIKEHAGDIRVTSVEGKGTTFCVELPAS